jgi:hypothetical protein
MMINVEHSRSGSTDVGRRARTAAALAREVHNMWSIVDRHEMHMQTAVVNSEIGQRQMLEI